MAVLGFDLHDSDFPLQTEFPILLYRLMEWYFPANGSGVSQVTAGEQVSLSLLPTTETAKVVTAAGKEISIAPPFPPQTLTETAEPDRNVLWCQCENRRRIGFVPAGRTGGTDTIHNERNSRQQKHPQVGTVAADCGITCRMAGELP